MSVVRSNVSIKPSLPGFNEKLHVGQTFFFCFSIFELVLTTFGGYRLWGYRRTPGCRCRTSQFCENPRPLDPVDSAQGLGSSKGWLGARRIMHRSCTTRSLGRSWNRLQCRLRSRYHQGKQTSEAPYEGCPQGALPILRSHSYTGRGRLAGEAQEKSAMGKLL